MFIRAFHFVVVLATFLSFGGKFASAQDSAVQPPAASAPAAATPAPAAPATAPSPAAAAQQDVIEAARKQIADASKKLDALSSAVDKVDGDDQKLVDLKVKVEALGKSVLDVTVSLRPRQTQIRDRLTALGNPPADPATEDQAIKEERDRLTADKVAINSVSSDAEALSISASKLANHITEVRRTLFTETLVKQTDINLDVLAEASSAAQEERANFSRAIGGWMRFVWNFKRYQLMTAIFFSSLIALFMVAISYRMFGPMLRHDPAKESPSYIDRLSVAFWSTLLPSLSFAAFSAASYFLMDNFNVLRADVGPIVASFFQLITAIFFFWKLMGAVLAPSAPNWRVVNVSDHGARLLAWSAMALAIVISIDFFLTSASKAMNSPLILTVVKSFFAALIAGVILLLMAFIRPLPGEGADGAAVARPWPRPVKLTFLVVGFGLIATSLLGYVGLARFAATQIVMVGAIVVTMYLGFLLGQAILRPGAFASTLLGRHLRRRMNLGELELDQAGLVSGLGIYFISFAIGAPLLFLQWGFHLQEIQLWVVQIFTEVTIGKFRFSLLGLLGGVLLFFLGLFATRWLQRWLDGNVLARSKLDSGVRNSVKTAFGYVGVAIATLLGISAAGIDLSSLALVAGALSLGIGFGLQNIVSNFVSGLILLVERPFKVGDWVVTGTTEGFVRRISVRATEIETFQHLSIIVPNSELINASVGNWTHKNRLGRVEVAVGVSYQADPRKVMEILLDIAHTTPRILKNPEPAVAFQGFGENALQFEIRVHLADVLDGTNVRNDMRIAIFERFREAGIDFPFPQRDVHFKIGHEVTELLRQAVEPSGPFKGNPDKVLDNMGGLRGHHGVDDSDGPDDEGDGHGDADAGHNPDR